MMIIILTLLLFQFRAKKQHLHQYLPWIHPPICCYSCHIYDSQMLPLPLDPENEHDYAWADSAYSGQCFDVLLSLGGFESLIHEKKVRNHPLSDAAKELNRIKSGLCRACLRLHHHVHGWKADEKDWA